MEWLTCIRAAVAYMEEHLTEIAGPQEAADHVHMSCMYLQKGFQILTGYTLGEYIRCRRLYLAAAELKNTDLPVTDIAMKYGYDTQAGFDKAFSRFHGATPREVRSGAAIRSFLPLTVRISIQGGENMKFRIEKIPAMTVVGFCRSFDAETSREEIPAFWDAFQRENAPRLMRGEQPENDTEKYVAAHRIGELGICLDDGKIADRFDYMIAGYSTGGPVPEGMTVRTVPEGTWAVFECTLGTLQETSKKIWNEWIPGNAEYEVSGCCSVEWYSPEGRPGPDQRCEIRIPVKAV